MHVGVMAVLAAHSHSCMVYRGADRLLREVALARQFLRDTIKDRMKRNAINDGAPFFGIQRTHKRVRLMRKTPGVL